MRPLIHLFSHFGILLFMLLGGGLIVMYSPYLYIKVITIVTVVATFCLWAILHHRQHQQLNRQVVWEYLFLIGIIIALFLFL